MAWRRVSSRDVLFLTVVVGFVALFVGLMSNESRTTPTQSDMRELDMRSESVALPWTASIRSAGSDSVAEGNYVQEGVPPFVLSASLLRMTGDQEEFSPPLESVEVRFFDSEHYSVDAVVTSDGGRPGARTRGIRSGSVTMREQFGPSGTRESQSIDDFDQVALAPFGGGEPPTRSKLRDFSVPVVDLADVDALVSGGSISDLGTTTILGRSARILDVPFVESSGGNQPEFYHRVWLDTEFGIKLRFESTSVGPSVERREEVAIDLSANVTLDEFDVVRDPEALLSEEHGEAFNPGTGSYPDEAADVLVPLTSTLPSGFVLEQPVFITSTTRMGVEYPFRMGWIVGQEIVSGTLASALVVQAPESQSDIPPGFDMYWPRYWQDVDPTQSVDSVFVQRTIVVLDDGTNAESYVLADPGTLGEGREWPSYRYLVTWVTSADVRVVMVGTDWLGTEQAMIDLVNEFIEAL